MRKRKNGSLGLVLGVFGALGLALCCTAWPLFRGNVLEASRKDFAYLKQRGRPAEGSIVEIRTGSAVNKYPYQYVDPNGIAEVKIEYEDAGEKKSFWELWPLRMSQKFKTGDTMTFYSAEENPVIQRATGILLRLQTGIHEKTDGETIPGG